MDGLCNEWYYAPFELLGAGLPLASLGFFIREVYLNPLVIVCHLHINRRSLLCLKLTILGTVLRVLSIERFSFIFSLIALD